MKYLILLPLLLLVLGGQTSQAAVVGYTDDAMIVGGGARPIGMAKAFCAIAEDADAPFINPAGIAGLKGPQAMSMFTNLMGDVYYSEFSGAIPSPYGTVGVGYLTTGVSRIPTPIGTTVVYTDYYDSLLLFTYSTPLGRFFEYGRNVFVGVNYKLFSRGWTGGVNMSATGVSADLGIKYIHSTHLSFGFNRQNILPVSMGGVVRWGSGTEEALMGINKLGMAVKPFFNRSVVLAVDIDLPAVSSRPSTLHLGAEWEINKNFALRCGLDQLLDPASPTGTSWSPAAGASVGYAGFRIDYAYHPYYNDPALATNYVSLSYTSEPWFALKGRTASVTREGRAKI